MDTGSEQSVQEALDRARIAVSPGLSDIRYVNVVMVFADRRTVDRDTQGDRLRVLSGLLNGEDSRRDANRVS
jgi:ABC-type multidrug transport system fused ATPase/permease subunit